MLCVTCGATTKKYKCPKCLEAYCSLRCYKKHQEVLCLPNHNVDKIVEHDRKLEPTLHEPFSTEDTVSRNNLELLKDCKALHDLLYNIHLRNLLSEIDVAPDAWKAMKAAMQEPLFLEFADECLKLVEPQNALE
ncbi:zinc finger HIT domain-containing protein 3 [Bactrocera oleae]|uniref:zinc finger HIT domain-containing protein 3 n=1 Tax=Bactrocera oleae TaxID=104688 RepID=UPI0006B6F926|nr:zinc finger HIT domain-containing protein 3 [Bactrocera oleae]